MKINIEDIFDSKKFDKLFFYDKEDLGVMCFSDETRFKIWAPTADQVTLKLYKNPLDKDCFKKIKMTKEDKGVWVYTLKGYHHGIYYTYEIKIGESRNEVVDSYAKAVGVNGKKGMIVDLQSTNPKGWLNHKKPPFKNMTDAIIYEAHIRDISINNSSGIKNKGKFLGLSELNTKNNEGESTGVEHLKELGITHIHLLPVFDFLSIDEENLDIPQYNWGYDPLNYNSLEGSYSTNPYDGVLRIKEFKEMIKTLHENGIRVVMDVVYNHTGNTKDSYLNLTVPNYYYRLDEDGNFIDESGCGNSTASERSMVRKFIVDSVVYFAREYSIDGFRFDLMGIHDIKTMKEVRKRLDEIDPSILVYGEGWAASELSLGPERMAVKENTYKLDKIAAFNDDTRDAIKGSYNDEREKGFASGKNNLEETVKFGIVGATFHKQVDYSKILYSSRPWANSPAQCINYVACHDNHTLWDKINLTNCGESESEKIKINKLCDAIVLTSQGIPFIHSGSELLRTKNFVENSYKSPDSVNEIDWSRKTKYKEVFEYYKGLIEIRKNHPAFRMTDYKMLNNNLEFLDMPSKNMVGYILKNNANKDRKKYIVVIFNALKSSKTVELPYSGWEIYADEHKASASPIGIVKGNIVSVSPRSALILMKD